MPNEQTAVLVPPGIDTSPAKDGEASLLGGLTSDSNTQAIAGLPGLATMPGLGYLFGTHSKDREKDDIIVALIPRIVRAPSTIDASNEGVLAGTERVIRVSRRPDANVAPPAAQPAPGVRPPQTAPPPLGGQPQPLGTQVQPRPLPATENPRPNRPNP